MRKTIKKVLSVMLSCILMLSALSVSSFATNEEFLTFELSSDGTGYIVTDCNTSTMGDIVVPQKYNDLPVVEIGRDAFAYCKKITSILLPETINNIKSDAFIFCENLTSINIPFGVTKLDGAFAMCSKLASITLPDSLTTIDYDTFWYCTSLASITIPDSVTEIQINAFKECTNLSSVKLGSGVKILNHGTFWGCTNLEFIFLPKTLEKVYNGAFLGCDNLRTIELEGNTTQFQDGFFTGEDHTNVEYVIFNSRNNDNIANYFCYIDKSSNITTSSSGMFFGTGDTVTTTYGDDTYSFTAIVKNDVNGDGVADVLDAAYVALCVNDLKEPDEIETLAIDCDDNSEIDVVDYQNLINVILEA